MRRAVVLGANLFAAACAGVQDAQVDPASDLALLEPVYRHQMAGNASSKPNFSPLNCLKRVAEGQNVDPPVALMERFGGANSKVLPASSCKVGDGVAGSSVTDPSSRLAGLILIIGDIRCPSATRCVVDGSYYEANQSASGNTYTAEKKAGRWVVTGDRINVIS
jgi:hypothetical protein